jgi:RNA polymerase sigma factor (sigma-70 family)
MDDQHFPLATNGVDFPLTTTVRQLFDETLPQYDSPWIHEEARRIQSDWYSKEAIVNFWYEGPKTWMESGPPVHSFSCRAEYESYVKKSLRGCHLDLFKADRRLQEKLQKYIEENRTKLAIAIEQNAQEIDWLVFRDCFRTLTKRQQRILYLTLRDKSDAEIAQLMSRPEAPVSKEHVRQIRYEARKKLAECLERKTKGGN